MPKNAPEIIHDSTRRLLDMTHVSVATGDVLRQGSSSVLPHIVPASHHIIDFLGRLCALFVAVLLTFGVYSLYDPYFAHEAIVQSQRVAENAFEIPMHVVDAMSSFGESISGERAAAAASAILSNFF